MTGEDPLSSRILLPFKSQLEDIARQTRKSVAVVHKPLPGITSLCYTWIPSLHIASFALHTCGEPQLPPSHGGTNMA